MSFCIESKQQGHFQITGELTLKTVPEAAKKGLNLFDKAEREIYIDLQDVSRTDSAGLALLVAWVRYAKEKNKTLQFLNIPAQMLSIARISSLDEILPLEGTQPLPSQPTLVQDEEFASPVG